MLGFGYLRALWRRRRKPRYLAPPQEPSSLGSDPHVALLVACRVPMRSHASLACVCQILNGVVSSPDLEVERSLSGWCGSRPPRHVVDLRGLDVAAHFGSDLLDLANMFSFYALINHVTGRKVFDLTREEKGAAAVDGLLPIVRVFYGADMYRLTGSTLQSTGGFEDHAEHTKVCLERICASDPADCGDRGTLSYYGRSLVEAGLLREYYDEQSGKMRFDADGVVMDHVVKMWSKLLREVVEPRDNVSDVCPLDVSLLAVVALCYVNNEWSESSEEAWARLQREMAAAGEELALGGAFPGLRDLVTFPGPYFVLEAMLECLEHEGQQGLIREVWA